MKTTQFAVPEKKKYRIDDAPHARNALARAGQHASPTEQRQVKAAVHRKYPSIGHKGKTAGAKTAAKSGATGKKVPAKKKKK